MNKREACIIIAYTRIDVKEDLSKEFFEYANEKLKGEIDLCKFTLYEYYMKKLKKACKEDFFALFNNLKD